MNHLAPGPGDERTWPACTGHCNDPRSDDDETTVEEDVREKLADAPEDTWSDFCTFMAHQHPGFVERPLVNFLLADKALDVGRLLQDQFNKFLEGLVKAKTEAIAKAGRISGDRPHD